MRVYIDYSLIICYMYRSSFGVLKTCFGENDLELYPGSLPLTVDGWEKDPLLSLREAAKRLNPINDFDVGRCNCKGGCQDQRCACRKKGHPAHRNVIKVHHVQIAHHRHRQQKNQRRDERT